MRRTRAALPVALAALALAGVAAASGPSVVILDWQAGHFTAGAPAGLEPVNRAAWPVAVDPCHRRVYADVLYAPEGAVVESDALYAQVDYALRVTVAGANWTVSTRVPWSGHGHFVGEAPHGGNATASLTLEAGADVAWELRLRGWEAGGTECADAS